MKRIKPEVSAITPTEIEAYCEKYSAKPSPLANHILSLTDESLLFSDMICGSLVGNLLGILISLFRPSHVLEVGAFTGYSASFIVESLPDEGRLTTIEANQKYHTLFQQGVGSSPLASKIELLKGYAIDIIPTFSDAQFDAIFVDADKLNYPTYLSLLKPKLRSGGLLIFDNTLWGGGVLYPEDKKSEAVHQLNKQLYEDPDFNNVLLPIRDGVHLAILK